MLHNDRMKKRELFSQLRVAGTTIVRVDGRGFAKALRKLEFDKPYDMRFAQGMVNSTADFFNKSGIHPTLAYLFSDEINFVFNKDLPFNGRLEKINSVIPSFLASALVIHLGSTQPMSFDSRVAIIDRNDITEYLNWRQEECWRNLVSSYGYYLLRGDGMGAKQAADKLKGMKSESLHQLAWEHGINLAQTPAWQRRGILVYKNTFEKQGTIPLTGEESNVIRSEVVQEWELPLFKSEEGEELINSIIRNPET
ncbi:MAG: tRNA 5'-guanylyltransferase [ANME-2 cluster archaeon]|nr:tRNA 5'-guanylyltransferase [ANME-2 cluster archaeon]